jgi:hypothetical protein
MRPVSFEGNRNNLTMDSSVGSFVNKTIGRRALSAFFDKDKAFLPDNVHKTIVDILDAQQPSLALEDVDRRQPPLFWMIGLGARSERLQSDYEVSPGILKLTLLAQEGACFACGVSKLSRRWHWTISDTASS